MTFGCKPAIKDGRNLLAYLLVKTQVPILILSGSFTIFDLQKRESVLVLRSLK